MRRPPIIGVHRGATLPRYAATALRAAGERTDSQAILLTDATVPDLGGTLVERIGDWYDPGPFAAFRAATSLDPTFRSGFYLHAAERFFILAQYAAWSGQERFLHMELDVLLSPSRDLAARLDALATGVFIPRDHRTRAIASLVYVNDPGVLRLLCDSLTRDAALGHEMRLLARFLDEEPMRAFALPTDAALADLDSDAWPSLEIADVGGIVDAAALGQWLLGTDPRNGWGPLINGFRNERVRHDLSRLRFDVDGSSGAIAVRRGDRDPVDVLCLHVHSKLLQRYSDPTALRAVTERMNRGRRTVLQWRRRDPG